MKILTLFCLTVALLGSPAAAASPVKARVPGGIGIVLLAPGSVEKPAVLTIYKEPFLERLAEVAVARLPSLAQSITSSGGKVPVIVTSRKSGWYRIIYDHGEREGWIKGLTGYQFYRWEELLRNRPVSLIAGLRKEFYLLRRSPDISAESITPLGKGSRVTPLNVDGEWLRGVTDSRTEGWLRWRDENGRLVIAVIL